MPSIQRKWDHLTKDQRYEAARAIASYFQSERDEEMGIIAAEEILDMVMEEAGKHVYRKGIEDARNAMRAGFESLEVDLEVLKAG